jgi:hypothetical protein
MIKRLIGKLKTLRNKSDFYKDLMRDWGKDNYKDLKDENI